MEFNYQVYLQNRLDWAVAFIQQSVNTPAGYVVLFIIIGLLIVALLVSMVTRRLSSYNTLLNFSASPIFVLDLQKGEIRYANKAMFTLFDRDNADSSGIVAQHCFQHLSSLTRDGKIENDVVHIKQLKKNIRLTAVKIKYRRRLAWLCQIDNMGTSACAISSWDMEGQIINSLFQSSAALVHVKTTEGLILNCSSSWAAQFDKSPKAVIGSLESDFYSASKISSIRSYEHAVQAGELQEYEEWSAFGEANILLHTIKSPLYDEHHQVVAILTISNDLTEVMELNERLHDEDSDHLRIEVELSRNSSLLNSVINAAPDPVAFMNENGKFVGANKGYCDVVNIAHAALIGMDRKDLISPDRLSWLVEQENELLVTGQSVRYEELVHLADNSTRWYEICKRRYVNSVNGESGILIIYRDLTERKQIEHELENAIEKFDKLSSTDELTNIANRRTFDCKLHHYWLTHQRESKNISLLFCDVDNFKLYNDNYGHQMGDLVLAKVAEAMNSQVRRGSDLLARYGGEEFAVILPNTDEEGARLLAEQMLRAIAELGIEHEHALAEKHVTLSIGIATMCPQNGVNEVQLIENADRALYQAKQQGRNQCCVFVPEKEPLVNIELNFDLLEADPQTAPKC